MLGRSESEPRRGPVMCSEGGLMPGHNGAAVVVATDLTRVYGGGDTAVAALRGVAGSDDLIDRVGRADRLQHRPAELSGGQQQRVAIARALVSRPTVVFADEPTGNLDSTSSGEILELLRTSVEAYGQTTVMVTHDAQAAAMADQIFFLSDGRIVQRLPRSDRGEILAAIETLDVR